MNEETKLAKVLLDALRPSGGAFDEAGVYPWCWICSRQDCNFDYTDVDCVEGIRNWLIEQKWEVRDE